MIGRAALALVATSTGLLLAAGLLGPSVAQPPLGPRRPHPPYSLFLEPSPWLVSGLVAVAIVLGAAAVALGLLALHRGWTPNPRRLLAGAAVVVTALMLVPPMGSADHLSYAAYGRILVAGDNPYVEAPNRWRDGGDPVAGAVEAPWRWTPSVYGPVGTAEQGLASLIGGSSVHTTVLVLMLINGIAFLGTGMLLHRMVRGDPQRQVRVALLWSLNPLLLYELVVGAHLDTVAVALGTAGLVMVRRHVVGALASGALVGAGVAVKLPVALFGGALVWAVRREPRRIAALAGGAGVVLASSYLAAGPHVFDQLRRAATYVSLATPWRLVLDPLTSGAGDDEGRRIITWLATLVAVLLAVVLFRALPRHADPDRPDLEAARIACVLTVAWVLAAPYALPWYDALVWAPLALLPASRLDLLLLLRTLVLALAYVPGRTVTLLPDDLREVTLGFRSDVAPWVVLVGVVSVLALGAARRLQFRPAPAP